MYGNTLLQGEYAVPLPRGKVGKIGYGTQKGFLKYPFNPYSFTNQIKYYISVLMAPVNLNSSAKIALTQLKTA